MASTMKKGTKAWYRQAAEEFAERAVQQLGDKVQAIVLSGPLAEGKRPRESDIEVIIVTNDTSYAMRDAVAGVGVDISEQYRWDLGFVSKLITPEDLREYLHLGLHAWVDMIANGVFLYDAETIASRCRDVLAAGGHDAG